MQSQLLEVNPDVNESTAQIDDDGYRYIDVVLIIVFFKVILLLLLLQVNITYFRGHHIFVDGRLYLRGYRTTIRCQLCVLCIWSGILVS